MCKKCRSSRFRASGCQSARGSRQALFRSAGRIPLFPLFARAFWRGMCRLLYLQPEDLLRLHGIRKLASAFSRQIPSSRKQLSGFLICRRLGIVGRILARWSYMGICELLRVLFLSVCPLFRRRLLDFYKKAKIPFQKPRRRIARQGYPEVQIRKFLQTLEFFLKNFQRQFLECLCNSRREYF